MRPTLWGPGLWAASFACAWHCPNGMVHQLLRLVMVLLPSLLPCEKCQKHFEANRKTATRKLGREPKTREDVFVWLYHLKDSINRTQGIRSISLGDLQQRHRLTGARVDDVLIADTIALVAIANRRCMMTEPFVEFCHILSALLPLPSDSELRLGLSTMRAPIVRHAYQACKNTRLEHGVPYPLQKTLVYLDS